MQYLLGNLKLQLMEGIYYFTPAGFVWMALFIVPLELGRMRDEGALGIVLANPLAFLLAATLGFFVNLLSFGVIQTTSSLTFKVLGQLKNVGVVLCSVFLFASKVSGMQALGYAISIVGFFLYNKAKSGPASPPVAVGKDVDAEMEATGNDTGSPAGGEAAATTPVPGGARGAVFSRQTAAAHVRNTDAPVEGGSKGSLMAV
jgi:drug/metabolite transporter (DMT)-like permease